MTSPTEGGPGGHPPRHSHVPPSPPKARAKQFSFSRASLLVGRKQYFLSSTEHLHKYILYIFLGWYVELLIRISLSNHCAIQRKCQCVNSRWDTVLNI